jgi:hypothetical protein
MGMERALEFSINFERGVDDGPGRALPGTEPKPEIDPERDLEGEPRQDGSSTLTTADDSRQLLTKRAPRE